MFQRHGTGVRAFAKPALSLAAAAGLAGLCAVPAHAENEAAAATEAATEVTAVEVVGAVRGEPESPKYVAPLLDTPQTITVVPRAVIEAQNLLTLRDILTTVPGITFGAGEAGGGYGDSINLRGYAAASDITVDGVRDSAQYSRSDSFNLEQLEVINGANGAQSGSGSVGGSINIVSKAPRGRDETWATLGAGTDNYGRLTLDANKALSDKIAGRINLMVHTNDAPGRDVERFRRWGVAPSLLIGLGEPTRATVSYFHQTDDNIPQYGAPFFNGRSVATIHPARYYGYKNIDMQRTNADAGTVILNHDFANGLSLRNLSRYQVVTQYAQVDAPERIFCLANGQKPVGYAQTAASVGGQDVITTNTTTGYLPCAVGDPNPGFYQPAGNHGTTRNSRNTEAYNQTDLNGHFAAMGIRNDFNVGVSYIHETFRLDGGNVLRNGDGSVATLPQMNIADPFNIWVGPVNYVRATIQYGDRKDRALYAFDTAHFGEHFEINGGLRLDHNVSENSTDTYSIVVGPALGTKTAGAVFKSDETLFSYRIGAVYKPAANASLYVAYGNTQTPSAAAVNGACTAATCNVEPEEAVNIEVGAKWNVGMISLTTAVFRNERSNYKVADPGNPDNPSGFQTLDGKSHVDGVALGAAGKITDQWTVFANYTYLDSEVIRSVSKFVAATVGDFVAGDPLTQTPTHAFSIYSTYNATPKFLVGLGATYQGQFYLSQHTGLLVAAVPGIPAHTIKSTLPLIQTEAYWVGRLDMTYKVNGKTQVRVNIANLFDKAYYTRIRNNGWATPGDTRNVTVSIARSF